MGNAPVRRIPGSRITVHPHVHGERAVAIGIARRDDGSSPRTWGTLELLDGRVLYLRFIPTYMGNALSA